MGEALAANRQWVHFSNERQVFAELQEEVSQVGENGRFPVSVSKSESNIIVDYSTSTDYGMGDNVGAVSVLLREWQSSSGGGNVWQLVRELVDTRA